MRVHAKLVEDRWGGRDWVLFDEGGYSHPLLIVTDHELELMLKEIEEQRASFDGKHETLMRNTQQIRGKIKK